MNQDNLVGSGINNPFEIGGLLLVINFTATKLSLHYNIGIQLPKILVRHKKEYHQTRSMMLEKMITEKKALNQLEKINKEAYDESRSNGDVFITSQGFSPLKDLKSIKNDISEVEMIIDKINRVTSDFSSFLQFN